VDVVGVDGAKGGWVAVELLDGRLAGIRVFSDFTAVADEYESRAAAIAVDMPIGLTEDGDRPADSAARRFIGPRSSSVFPAPPRWVLDASGYDDITALRPDRARGVTRQTFALIEKIKEVAKVVEGGAPVYEVHPEVSFRALKGATLEWPKKSYQGTTERLRLLERIRIGVPLGRMAGCELDDVVDACVCAWSADRIATGNAKRLPSDSPPDAIGVIWF
jgi:predicted RNase H-like nuclease